MFLDVLGATCARFNWMLHAYCLMTNHYHLLVETPDANLSKVYLGSEQFVERMQARIDPKRSLPEVPKRQRRALAKPLAEYAAGWPDRHRAMAEAYRSGAYSMQPIAEDFGVSRMTVSRAVKRDENAAVTGDPIDDRCGARVSGAAVA